VIELVFSSRAGEEAHIVFHPSWFKVAIAGFDVAVARQIIGYIKFFPFFFLEFDLLLQSRSKELILDFSSRWFCGAGLLPL